MEAKNEEIENETESQESSSTAATISEEFLYNEDVMKQQQREKIDAKLKFYAEECKRYSIAKIKIIQDCVEEIHNNCNLHEYIIGTLQCQIMFETFKMFPSTPLTAINLRNNHLEHFCCHSMASFVATSMTLREFNLQGCAIGDNGIEILASAFATSNSLVYINLSKNQITDDGGEKIAEFLIHNESCKEIDLSFNKLSIKTSMMLCEVLKTNKSLMKLDLSHNQLHEQSAIVYLMRGLRRNETLEYLDISWNGLFCERFGKNLSRPIKSAKLKVFKVENNQLTSFHFRKLALGVQFSETIEEIHVGGNFFISDDDETLIKAFEGDSPLKFLSLGKYFHISHKAFELLQEIKTLKSSIKVIYQNIILPNAPRDVSMLDIYADRAKYLAMKPKKKRLKRDMSVFMGKLKSLEYPYMSKADFMLLLNKFNAKLDDELIDQYVHECTHVQYGVDVHLMAIHYLNRHENRNS